MSSQCQPDAFDFTAASLLILYICLFCLLFLFLRRLCRFPFRLNGGLGARFRLNAFGFSAPFLFSLLLAVARPETVSFTERRLWNRLLLNAFGVSAPSLSSFFYLTLTLPTTSRIRSSLLTETLGFAAPSPFLSLPTESRLRSRLSTESFGFAAPYPFLSLPTESRLRLRCSLSFSFSSD
jgi:hypothetical protein